MALSGGTRIGSYEIREAIGAGGMGEVYRARDTRLDREVAVKILPAGFAANPEFKARFEREAKTISQLSHPNVCSLFDVGNHEGTEFLVMELIEGDTLADRLKQGRLDILVLLHWNRHETTEPALELARSAGVPARTVHYAGFTSLQVALAEQLQRLAASAPAPVTAGSGKARGR